MGKNLKVILWFFLFCAAFLGVFFFFSSKDYFSKKEGGAVHGGQSRNILYWIDPMEPQIHYEGAGKSRMGMTLVPVYDEALSGKNAQENFIQISPALVQNLGVRTAAVVSGVLTPSVRAFGTVRSDEEKIVHVHAYTEGWIEKLHVKKNQEYVKKDQPLFEIYSRELRLAQKEFLLGGYAGIATEKLRSLGVSEKQIERLKKTRKEDPLVTVYAPKDGYVDMLNIREGMWVDPEMTILSLTDLSEVWVIADVFPSYLKLIQAGQDVVISLPQTSNKPRTGKIDYVYPMTDPISLTTQIRIRLKNPDVFLKPHMYVSVEINLPSKKVIKIPKEAVIWTEGAQHVVVSLGEGRFQPREVQTGIEDRTEIEIISGLKEGEEVVTSAQFLLDSEINLKMGLARLDSSSHSHHGHGG